MIDTKRPLRTRGGLPATLKAEGIEGAAFSMLAEIQFPDGHTELHSYLPTGCFSYGACDSPLDLVNVDDSTT